MKSSKKLCGGTCTEEECEICNEEELYGQCPCLVSEVEEQAKASENCMDSCARCGSYVMDNDKFCSNCGVSLKVAEKEIASFDTLSKIVEQLEFCKYECQGGPLKNNRAFVALKQIAEKEGN